MKGSCQTTVSRGTAVAAAVPLVDIGIQVWAKPIELLPKLLAVHYRDAVLDTFASSVSNIPDQHVGPVLLDMPIQ
jgi:hypothetical protein